MLYQKTIKQPQQTSINLQNQSKAQIKLPKAKVTPQQIESTEIKLNNNQISHASLYENSKWLIPHYYLTAECQIDELLSTSKELNISLDAILIKAIATTIQGTLGNASWQEDVSSIRKYHDVNIRFQLNSNTLKSPVIRNASTLNLLQLNQKLTDLITRGNNASLTDDEVKGATFSYSNIGSLGVSQLLEVVNLPHSCHLAVGTQNHKTTIIKNKNGGSRIASITTLQVTLACDHRVVDGSVGAALLDKFKKSVESPNILFLVDSKA